MAGVGLNSHTKAQREWIVKRLAGFGTPRDIAVAFVARFPDTACTENDVRAVDPRISIVAPDLIDLYKAERLKVREDPDRAPFANRQNRRIVLNDMVEAYLSNNQLGEARATLKLLDEMDATGDAPPSGAAVQNVEWQVVDAT